MDTEYANIGTSKDVNQAMLAAMSFSSRQYKNNRYSKSSGEMMSRNNAIKKNPNLKTGDLKKEKINTSDYWWLF